MHQHQPAGVSLQDALTAIMQDLQSPTARDKKKSVDGLVTLLSEVVERGTCPMEALGQHVCCNIMALIMQHYVTPALMKQRSSLAARTEVTKPFYQLLELLHKHVPLTFKHQPLLWKGAKPLHMLMKHVTEVLEGTTTGVHCCQDYAAMITMLMRVAVYRTSITRRVVYELSIRLLQLLKDGIQGGPTPLSEAALEQLACAVAALTSCPHFVSALANHPIDIMKRLLEVTMRRHEQATISSPLKVEMHLITAIRRLAEGTQHDHKQCAQLPWKLVKVVLSTWHMTTRRDGWRLEAVQFVTHQLAVVFSELTHHAASANIHQRRRSAADSKESASVGADNAQHQRLEDVGSPFAHGASCPPVLASYVDELHASILPAVLSILSAPKCEFSVVSSRELSHAPCPPLQPLFDFAAFVLFLAQRTYPWAHCNATAAEEAARAEGHEASSDGEREKKRHRAAASPLLDVVGHLTTLAKDPAANTFRRDVSCVWLHTLSVPVGAMWLTAGDAAQVLEALVAFCPLGGVVEQPLLAALANVVPHANLSQQLRIYQWAQSKYMPCTGVDVDDGAPSPLAYELLTRILEGMLEQAIGTFCNNRTGSLLDAATVSVEGAGVVDGVQQRVPFSYQVLVPTAVQSRSYHFTEAATVKEELCMPMLRYTIRLSQLGFFADITVPEAFDGAAILNRILTLLAHHDVHQQADALREATALLAEVAQLEAAQRLLAMQRQGTAPAAAEERICLGAKVLAAALVHDVETRMVRLPTVVEVACLPDAVLHQPFDGKGVCATRSEPLHPLLSPSAADDEASSLVQKLANSLSMLTLGLVAQQRSSVGAQSTSDTTNRTSPTVSMATLGGRALQLADAILFLRKLHVWSCPSSDIDGSRLAELVTRGGHNDASVSMADIMAQLSPQGVVLYCLQSLLDVAANRFARCSSIVDEAQTLPALQHLLEHSGKELFSVDVSLWEPSQRMLSHMGLIGRKLLEGISALATCKSEALSSATVEGSCSLVATTLMHICTALRWFYVTLRATDICLASTDPLINVHHAITAVTPVLRGPLLHLGEAANVDAPGGAQSQPNLSMALLESACGLMSVLVVLNNEDAHSAVLDALRILFSRHPHSHSGDIFGVMTLFGEDACPPWSVATRHKLGALCELVVTTLRRNDQDTGNLLSPTPPLQLALHVSMVHCIAHVLGRCESAQAERLAKLFFQFSGVASTFSVRLATATLIAVPFRVFSRVGSVLQELQFHAKDAIMSAERSTAATALLALSNACRSAPQLEADVISFMLEFYSTRDFHHRPLIVQALQRIANAQQHSGGHNPLGQSADWAIGGALSTFAALTRHHAHRLLYDWLWRFGHPMEALPIRCFGYDTLQEMAANFVAVMLPVALLHMQQQDKSGGGRGPTASAMHHPAVALFHMFAPSGDTTGLLRDNFTETVASLLLFQEAKHSTPCTKAHAELADAAAYALEWVSLQLGRELFRDMCKRHADSIVTVIMQRCGKGSGSCLVAGDGGDTAGGVAAIATMVFALPGVSFAVGSKALASLCSLVDAGTIRQFFSAFQGDRAFYLLSHMYLEYMTAPSTVATCDALIALQQVVSGWLTPCLIIPHVLESALHIVCNILNGGAVVLPSTAARALVCDLIKHIWATVRGTPNADKLLRPHAPLVSSTLLSLKHQFVDVGRLWTDLSAADTLLRRADWHHQQTQFASFSQEQHPFDVDENDADDGRARAQDKTTTQQQAVMLRVLEDVDLLAGTPTANFYRDLGDALDREVDTVVAAIHHDPRRGCSAVRLAAQHLLQVATATAADAVPLDTRVAALAALRALYVALLEAKRLMPATTRSVFGSEDDDLGEGHPLMPLFAPSMVLQLHGKPKMSLIVDQAFLSGVPHDMILDKAYAFVLQHLRDLCHHRHPALVLEASAAVRGSLASQHEIMTRAKAYVEKEDKALHALLQPFQRDAPIPTMRRQHPPHAAVGSHLASSYHPLSANRVGSDTTAVSSLVAPLEGSITALAQSSAGGLPPPLQGGVLAAPVLWNLLPHQPDTFLCYFVKAFVEYYQLDTKLVFLQSILPVVHIHPPTAAVLLPVVFLHAVMLNETESQRRARRAWSECIRTRILQQAASLQVLTRTFLSALDTVRCALTSVLKVAGRQKKRASTTSNPPLFAMHVKTAAGYVPAIESVTDVWWLSDLSAMDLALAAAACEQWNTSALYLELSCESTLGKPGLVPLTLAVAAQASLIPAASENRRVSRDVTRQAEVAVQVQKHRETLLGTSMSIGKAFGDRDWVDACSRHATLTVPLSALRCEVMGNWQQALQQYDTMIRLSSSRGSTPSPASPDIARCLMHLGCANTAAAWMLATIRSSLAVDSAQPIPRDVRSALAEAAWRTSQWDMALPPSAAARASAAVSLQECIFMALKALHSKDTLGYRVAMRAGQGHLLAKLSGHMSALDAMVYSQLFHDIGVSARSGASGGGRGAGSVFAHRAQSDAFFHDDDMVYDRVEVLDCCRTVLCRLRGDLHAWARHATAAAERALAGNMVTLASQQVQQFLDAVQDTTSGAKGGGEHLNLQLAKLASVALCKARILVAQGDASMAIRTLQGVDASGRDAAMHANVVRCIVQWAHDAQIVPTESLLQDAGFHNILKVREPGGRSSYLMASLCDVVLRELQTRWESPEAQRLRQSIKESSRTHDELKRQVDTLKRQSASSVDASEQQRHKEMIGVLRHRMDHLAKDMEQYNTQQHKLMHDWTLFRNTALHHYAKALAEGGGEAGGAGSITNGGVSPGDPGNLCSGGRGGGGGNQALHAIFRLVDLWLTPPANVTVNEDHERPSIMGVPTQYYLHLFTQLAARLTSTSSAILRDVVLTVAADYPHQTLWTLSALANGNRWTAAERTTHSSDNEKIALARGLLNELKARPALAPIVKGVEQLAEAFMELAFEKPPKEPVIVPIKPNARLMQSRHFQMVPVPTVYLPPDATSAARAYKLGPEVLTVMEYRPHYERAGGINVPKILHCITSSGKVEKQLLKSNDDMRQDAIIEQVFGVVNALLQHDAATRHRRHLSIRRYQVVPLGPSTGILQWVNQTMPLGHYLIGNPEAEMLGAHARYFPDELTLPECRERLDHKRVQGPDRAMAYREITSRFTPAMHYFFLEYFATPEVWLQKKRAYANSVAAASMVGYLVGLGDRHLSNLLIHTNTAEIVMIDLGIAFEQGKLLRMPELVPFRLTRDMVDGLGMHGVEGHFRSACEATLRCTREHKALLGTILDAFIHDPLAKWAVDTTDAIAAGSIVTSTAATAVGGGQEQQGRDPAGTAKATTTKTTKSRQNTADADRAVARVREKLNGYEGGEAFSVEGQVQRLIQIATSEEYLAQMFEGWSAWV